MSIKAGIVAGLLVVMAVMAACVPAAPQTQKVVHFDPAKTKMGEIQARGRILIGIPDDYFPFGYFTRSGKPTGFTAGLGQLVADALGVRAAYVGQPSSRLLGLVDSGRADLVFPMTPITESANALHPFSDPYYLAHQRLLVPSGSAIAGADDLVGKTVCSAIDPATEVPLTRLLSGVRVLPVAHALDCAQPLRSGKAAAATGPDVALLGLRSRLHGGTIVGGRLTTEGYGAAVSPCAPGLAQFVSHVFAAAKAGGDWTTLYKRWILPASGSSYVPDPPTLSVIDAWDLFPSKPGSPSPAPVACPSS